MTTLIEFVELLVREIWLRNRRGGAVMSWWAVFWSDLLWWNRRNTAKRARKKSKGQVKFRNYR